MPRRKRRHSRWRMKDAPAPQENPKRIPLKPRPDAYKKISGAFRKEEAGKPRRNSIHSFGAGEGNRTLLASLEGWSITTMLHPQWCEICRLIYNNIFFWQIKCPHFCVSLHNFPRNGHFVFPEARGGHVGAEAAPTQVALAKTGI